MDLIHETPDNSENFYIPDGYELVGVCKSNGKNVWRWTHTGSTCRFLFNCDWKELDLNWVEECQKSFSLIPKIKINYLKEIQKYYPNFLDKNRKISPKLYVIKDKDYRPTVKFWKLLVEKGRDKFPGLKKMGDTFSSLKDFNELPLRENLISKVGVDSFDVLVYTKVLNSICLNKSKKRAYYYNPILLK